jgi:hypothetical protein
MAKDIGMKAVCVASLSEQQRRKQRLPNRDRQEEMQTAFGFGVRSAWMGMLQVFDLQRTAQRQMQSVRSQVLCRKTKVMTDIAVGRVKGSYGECQS